jgi:glycosyltransferase involved in cell wall biosynthesis
LEFDEQNKYVFFYFEHNVKEMEFLGKEKWKKGAILLENQAEVRFYMDKIDLYFCPFGALWPRPVPVPSVVTVVDAQEKYYPQFFTKQALWNREKFYKASTKTADQVITISEFSKESIASFHRLNRKKIHVAYLAADQGFFEPLRPLDRRLHLPGNYIFYPANFWLHKNHDNLLKALLFLKNKFNLKVDCILTGFEVDNGYPLEKKINEYGLKNQVKTIGYVNQEEIKHIYAGAKMLCFPSLFEGFGMPIVEAMAVGCPVVCSNAASIPEITGDEALLFDPNDPLDIAAKIRELWTDEKMRKTLTAKGKERVKKFSFEKTAEKHLEVFEQALKSFKKSRYFFYRYLYEPFHAFKMKGKRKRVQKNRTQDINRMKRVISNVFERRNVN